MGGVLSEKVRGLLDRANPGVLATVNPDGSPQTSVVWVGRDGDDLLISTAAGRRKERNLRRDPRASLSMYDLADLQLYVEVRGTVTITEDVGRELAIALAEKYDEGPEAVAEIRTLPPEVVRVVIRLTPTQVLGYATD